MKQGTHLSKTSILNPTSHRNQETGALSSLLMAFQRCGSQILEKPFLGCKTGKRILKRFTPKRGRDGIHSYRFSKVNASKIWQVRGLESGRNLGKVWSSLRGTWRTFWSVFKNSNVVCHRVGVCVCVFFFVPCPPPS